MKKVGTVLRLSMMLLALCVITTTQSMKYACAESYVIDKDINDQWQVYCDLEQPEQFNTDLYQYAYTQKSAVVEKNSINNGILSTFGWAQTLTADSQAKAFMFSGDSALMLRIPNFIERESSNESISLDSANDLLGILKSSLFHPYDRPYLQTTLFELYQSERREAIGLLESWENYTRLAQNGNSRVTIEENDMLYIYVPEIDGYPIVPQLFGSVSDSDVPMYALVLLHEHQPLYMEMGCSYEIAKQRAINETPISWKTAIDFATNEVYKQWEPAWSAMSTLNEGNFNYVAFWQTYSPRFVIRVASVHPCYYARNNVLRPGWQVNIVLEINLSNDDLLAPEDRHHYVPEVTNITYVFDAITGEKVT